MRPSFAAKSAGLTITDPLVLYRTLLSTNRIRPDPAQHRLAIHLQGLYVRLKDYEPHIEYAERLKQISRAIEELQTFNGHGAWPENGAPPVRRAFSALLWPKRNDSLALTQVLSSHDGALQQDSPRGLLVHGEVGTGKSMLIDLLADALPTRKKRRWHFNTFMLETFARLERIRRGQNPLGMSAAQASLASLQAEEYSILQIVRDMIYKSPIIFLDEFQLPDRATSRILSNMLTLFFQLGGVLVATSNRMPEELAEAAGIEYVASSSRLRAIDEGLRRIWRNPFGTGNHAGSGGLAPEKNDSFRFLEVLKARCEVWQMEGQNDWRRSELRNTHAQDVGLDHATVSSRARLTSEGSLPSMDQLDSSSAHSEDHARGLPDYYHVSASSEPTIRAIPSPDITWERCLRRALGHQEALDGLNSPAPWQSSQMQVYGRTVLIPRACAGVSYWTFAELCGRDLGPADYISLASRCHTVVLVDVPVISFLQRNEARRFITLLDALYEARCKLLVRAAAGPDDIFFPGSKQATSTSRVLSSSAQVSTTTDQPRTLQPRASNTKEQTPAESDDSIYSETFSEIHQDLTSPFRPNISSYATPTSGSTAPVDPADEDSDFGPLHPGRSHGLDSSSSSATPDFTRGAGAFLGEDERFAYKRAESRLWEMCGARWWARQDGPDQAWWKPVPEEARHWERSSSPLSSPPFSQSSLLSSRSSSSPERKAWVDMDLASTTDAPMTDQQQQQQQQQAVMTGVMEENALPLELPTNRHPDPPKFSWVHAWGLMRWGKKAGKWGQGVEGLGKK